MVICTKIIKCLQRSTYDQVFDKVKQKKTTLEVYLGQKM